MVVVEFVDETVGVVDVLEEGNQGRMGGVSVVV